ncbi:MAG: hypothetical protein ACTHKT_13040 [Solirubrobacterales bacterium]
MSKQQHKQSPTPAPTLNGRRLVLRGEAHAEPKWDVYIAALLAYSLRAVQEEPKRQERDGG